MSGKILKLVIGIVSAGAVGGGFYFFLRWRKKNREEDEVLSAEYFFDRKEADQMLKDEIDKDPRSKMDIHAEIDRVFDSERGSGIVRDKDDPRAGDAIDIDKKKFAKGIREYTKDDEAARRNFEEYMAAMESPEEDDEDDIDDEDEEEENRPVRGHHYYPISAAQFCNSRNYYDKVSLSYYTDDNVVSDEKDKVMDNAEEVLGRLQELFDGDEYPTVCYIRNDELEIDYEISIIEGSYRHEVLGEEV